MNATVPAPENKTASKGLPLWVILAAAAAIPIIAFLWSSTWPKP